MNFFINTTSIITLLTIIVIVVSGNEDYFLNYFPNPFFHNEEHYTAPSKLNSKANKDFEEILKKLGYPELTEGKSKEREKKKQKNHSFKNPEYYKLQPQTFNDKNVFNYNEDIPYWWTRKPDCGKVKPEEKNYGLPPSPASSHEISTGYYQDGVSPQPEDAQPKPLPNDLKVDLGNGWGIADAPALPKLKTFNPLQP